MAAILGISAFYHDAAAALVVDGQVVAAAQEERFSRVKHDQRFPQAAIEYCLDEAGLTPEQLDFVGFYEKPLLKFERLLETYLTFAPRGLRSFASAMPMWLKQKLHLPREMRRGLDGQYKKRFVFIEHHQSHAASAFLPSPFSEAAILTLDGVGEWTTTSFGVGLENKIELQSEIRFPHSMGLLYSAFTYYCGFRVNSGEYKLMGLAPYGEPEYADLIRSKLIDVKGDGSFRLDLSYFAYCYGLVMTSPKFHRLFGGPPREGESEITQRHMNLAASIQTVVEEVMLKTACRVHEQTGQSDLCLAGGVALNCVGNGRILREGPFQRLWIQPAAGDAGGAVGVALYIAYALLDRPRTPEPFDSQSGSLLGPRCTESEIETCLHEHGAVYHRYEQDDQLWQRVVELLGDGKIVGLVQGRMEYGPRALGSRSIIGDPRDPTMQSRMNQKIKFRESFRPFAPSVLQEQTSQYFQLSDDVESPYMLLVAPVAEQRRLPAPEDAAQLRGLERLGVPRSTIPAVTHVDGSARIQTVDPKRHGRYYDLVKCFQKKTGCPVLINTSFNVRGEPIVCTAEDAYRCFMATGLDALVLENYLLLKEQQ